MGHGRNKYGEIAFKLVNETDLGKKMDTIMLGLKTDDGIIFIAALEICGTCSLEAYDKIKRITKEVE